mgnify:FL=1
MISSIVDRLISFGNLRSSKYGEAEKNILKNNFFKKENIDISEDSKKDSDVLELGCWLVLNRLDNESQHLKDQIHKRWNWAISNFNFFMALIFAIFIILLGLLFKIIPITNICWTLLWFVITISSILIFYFNGNYARNSVLKMDRILVRNFETILSMNENIRESKISINDKLNQ